VRTAPGRACPSRRNGPRGAAKKDDREERPEGSARSNRSAIEAPGHRPEGGRVRRGEHGSFMVGRGERTGAGADAGPAEQGLGNKLPEEKRKSKHPGTGSKGAGQRNVVRGERDT